MIDAIFFTIIQILELYKWVVIISALITWVNPDPSNPVVQILGRLTQPVYDFIKRYIPTSISGIDLSPIIVIFAIIFVQQVLSNIG